MDNIPIDQLSKEEQLNMLRNAMMQKAFGQQTPIEETEEYKQAELAAQQQREGNQTAQLANIFSTMAENITGARKGHRLGMQEDAINKLKALQAQRGKSGQDSLAALRALYNMENTRDMAANKEEGKQGRHVENVELRKDKFKWQQTEEDEKKLDKEINAFRKSVNPLYNRLDAARTARMMIDSDNPIADKALLRKIARMSGEVGAMTEKDVTDFAGSGDIVERVEQAITTMVNGKLTPDNREYLRKLIDAFERGANENLKKRAELSAKQRGFGALEKQMLYDKYLGNEEWTPERPAQVEAAPPSQPKAETAPQPSTGWSDEEQKELEELERLEAEGKL